MAKKLSERKKNFEERIQNKFGNRIKILTEFKGMDYPIKIIYTCDFHGDTIKEINPKNILAKSFSPCKKCSSLKKSLNSKDNSESKEYFYGKLKNKIKSNGGVLLSKEWTLSKNLYKIKCEKGHLFENSADKIMNSNQWCPYCCGRKGFFENSIKEIIKRKNGELLSEYKNVHSHIKVKCNKHNYIWSITPNNLFKDRWCPVCNLPMSEKVIYDYLKELDIDFEIQYKFKDLVSDNNVPLRYDFTLFNNRNPCLIIESDGSDHRSVNSKKKSIMNIIKHDKVKKRLLYKKQYLYGENSILFKNEL